jgi:imidazoleglycerol-phosphate dehydratase
MDRRAEKVRQTSETDISIAIALDNSGESAIDTGVPFFDHMLKGMSRHGRFSLQVKCRGDIEIDDHHSVEDVGLVLGEALAHALGECRGINRFGDVTLPMDDALVMAAVDISGRPYFTYRGELLRGRVGGYSEELTQEFFRAFTQKAGITLHVHLLDGENRHHIHEAIFKAVGVALRRAWRVDGSSDDIPSTKGTLV